ncbi:phage tail protein [Serratia symbiotica]|uniref:phage tail protein n=1 Tax=Serratia symbiotica TaxID=138074 RepID=UPI0015D3D750|nr:phage tail protein [Serratia symbiotica]MBQ0956919.1 tail fiber protein [Serratia symbiotica]
MQKIGDITTTADPQGEFTDGNVAQGVSPTILPAAWFTTVQRELIAVLTDAGLKPDKSDDSQVSKAIQKMLSEGIDKAVVPASLTKAGITKLSNETNSDDETTAATPKSVTDALTGAKGVNLGDIMTVGARYPANGSKCTTFMSNYTPHLSAAKGSAKPALEISNQGNKDAVAALLLHREGDFATYFGLDTDNALAIGGYSLDGKRYRIYHENFTGDLSKKSTASLEPTGWFRDSDTGVIKQWGIVNRNGDTTRVTFPTQFPNACVNVQLTLRNSNAGGSTSNVFANNEDTQGFNYITASHEVQSFWMAIGY